MATQSPIERKIVLAALKCAAKGPWHDVTLEQIAKTAKTPLSRVKSLFPDSDALVPAIVGFIDAEMAKAAGKPDRKAPARDRLFEVLMARFDALQTHRKGILSVADACKQSPSLASSLVKAQWESVRLALRLAALEQEKLPEMLQRVVLLALYHFTVARWASDDSADMAKTMASLDRALRRSAAFASLFLKID